MIKPWKTLNSKQTFKDRYLSVRTDQCEQDNGYIVPTYHVLEYTEWATLIPVTDDGNVVVIHEYRHPGGQIFTGLPGGVSEPGEVNIALVAARELREETGYSAREIVPVGSCYPNPAIQDNQLHYYLALGCRLTHPQSLDANEEIEVSEMPYSEFLEYENLQHQHALHAAALFYAERYFTKHPHLRP